MTTKFMFIVMRGIGLFTNYLKSNLLSLFALSALFLILHTAFGLGSGMADFANKAASFDKIRAYISSDRAVVDSVSKALESMPEKASIRYYSPRDAKNYIQSGAGSLNGIENLPEELFPAFIEVSIKQEFQNIDDLEAISAKIAAISGVNNVSYGQEWARQLNSGKNAVTSLLVIVSALFAVVGIVLIYQTVSISLYRYRKEVHVYDIVGATRFFIAMPFVVVAVCMGVLCSLISFLFYVIFRFALLVPIEGVLGLNISIGSGYALTFIILAVLISTGAGLVSVRNFLKR